MPEQRDAVVVGVDFGTLSARALVVRVSDGLELGSGTAEFRHGAMETQLAADLVPADAPLPPDWALQVPADYVEALALAVRAALSQAGVRPEHVTGIGTDFTACTVLPVLRDGTPLCELPEFRDRPHAYVKLWKHHAAQAQADRLTDTAHARSEPWIARYGGRLSSEWELAKGLQLLEEDPEIYDRMDHWVEAADWIVWQLCGVYVRNVCTAGFKGARQDGNYPSTDYFAAVNPDFAGFGDKLQHPVSQLGSMAGGLMQSAADRLGLPAGIPVCVGNVDAHVTAPAARAVRPGQLVAIMGTSTCHVMVGDRLAEVPGMCGVVKDGIVPGLLGYEAGQSGVGDIFGAFVDSFVPGDVRDRARAAGRDLHEHLTDLALAQPVGAHGLVALDWHSGNRSVLVDHDLSGVIVGLTLQTQPQDIYRALIEATAFGTRVIIDAFETAGLPVIDFIAAGGLIKNPLVMQVYADVLRRPIHVIGSDQGPALGSAMHAAVAAGAYPEIGAAAAAMGRLDRDVWKPDPARADIYDRLFGIYRHLHDHFGRIEPDLMHDLRVLRRAAARG
jgi:L-ribulokinase